MTLQFQPNYLIARTLLMFLNTDCKEVVNLNEVFSEVNGLSLREYLRLAFVVYAALREGPTFTKIKFTATDIPQLKVDLSDKVIDGFLNILATDYAGFLERDTEVNQDVDQHFTKNRYNPLVEYPIIETDLVGFGRGYIVPNVVVYLQKATGGVFWWFHNYYEMQGKDPLTEFRTPFGKVFEQYVGIILKGIYGEENVHGEILYGDGRRFIDWYVEKDAKVYLFEVKAAQFALPSRTTGYKDVVLDTEAKKISGAIKQVYNRVKDIEVYEELARFRGKEIIPIIVLLDIPYPSSRFFQEWVKEKQAELADDERIPELREFNFYLMNIRELELCDGIADKVAIEEVLEKASESIELGFEGILQERLGRPLENRLLVTTCSEFLGSILETD
jgi:predicted RNase H-like HicB family nuclease